jgi:hypothetical protein
MFVRHAILAVSKPVFSVLVVVFFMDVADHSSATKGEPTARTKAVFFECEPAWQM